MLPAWLLGTRFGGWGLGHHTLQTRWIHMKVECLLPLIASPYHGLVGCWGANRCSGLSLRTGVWCNCVKTSHFEKHHLGAFPAVMGLSGPPPGLIYAEPLVPSHPSRTRTTGQTTTTTHVPVTKTKTSLRRTPAGCTAADTRRTAQALNCWRYAAIGWFCGPLTQAWGC